MDPLLFFFVFIFWRGDPENFTWAEAIFTHCSKKGALEIVSHFDHDCSSKESSKQGIKTNLFVQQPEHQANESISRLNLSTDQLKNKTENYNEEEERPGIEPESRNNITAGKDISHNIYSPCEAINAIKDINADKIAYVLLLL